jgi:hypothetical protein
MPGSGWLFFFRWSIATAIAWILGMAAAFPLSYLLNVIYPKTTNLLVGICIGVAVGLAQKVAAGRYIKLSWGWVWGAMIGMGLPFVVGEIIDVMWQGASGYTGDRMIGWIVVIGTGGLIAGAIQSRVLLQFTSKAVWWIPASIASWLLAWVGMNLSGMAGLAMGGLVLGAVSGGLFILIMKSPSAPETI